MPRTYTVPEWHVNSNNGTTAARISATAQLSRAGSKWASSKVAIRRLRARIWAPGHASVYASFPHFSFRTGKSKAAMHNFYHFSRVPILFSWNVTIEFWKALFFAGNSPLICWVRRMQTQRGRTGFSSSPTYLGDDKRTPLQSKNNIETRNMFFNGIFLRNKGFQKYFPRRPFRTLPWVHNNPAKNPHETKLSHFPRWAGRIFLKLMVSSSKIPHAPCWIPLKMVHEEQLQTAWRSCSHCHIM